MRRTITVVLVMSLIVPLVGCHQTQSTKPTQKTPNQILWQMRDHIRQVAKDVKNAKDLQLIDEDKYVELQKHVETAAKYFNQLKSHYELWKELDDSYRSKVTVTLLFVAKELQAHTKKEDDGR